MTRIARPFALVASLIGVLLAHFPRLAVAQATGSSVIGTVRDGESGGALPYALIDAGQRHIQSDSLGRWSLGGLAAGATHIRVRRVGFVPFDTAVVLQTTGELRVDVQLQPLASNGAIRAAETANTAAGRTDSSALGLLPRSPAPPETFGPFGARLLRTIARDRASDSNTVLSPTSVAFALSIPLLGAGGATATEIASAIGVQGMDPATLRRRTAAAMTEGTGRSDVQLEIANAIWVDTSVQLNRSFVDAVASYRASVRSEALASQAAVPVINAWVDSVTHGKITQLLKDPFPDSARLFIANAVYYKRKILDEFDNAATRRRAFRLATGEVVRVDGMERTGHVGYSRGERFQMIRLPYRGGRFAMYVVLPDSGVSADAIEENFVAHGMPVSLTQKDFRDVDLVLPRLHAELSYDLVPALKSLGIRSAFDCDYAEFYGIARERVGGLPTPLCIAKASQSVYLDIDEEGTEAAAVTGLSEVTFVGLPPPPIQFIVDRPFLFLLRDEQTGADLFVGTIRRP